MATLERFVAQHGIPLVSFRKGERKDAVMAERLAGFNRTEGVVFVGKAQEKAQVFRTEKRRSPRTGQPYPWIVRSSVMVNHYYIYAVDRDFGPAANRRLIEVERLSHDCVLAEHTFRALSNPVAAGRQRASGLRFADARTRPLLEALILFRQLPDGFRAADLRRNLAALSARHVQAITQGAATYQLRRLRLHGLIERIPKSFRYRVTDLGLRVALFFTRAYNRLLRPGLAVALPGLRALTTPLNRAFNQLDTQLNASIGQTRLAT